MDEEQKKQELRETVENLVKGIRIAKAVLNEEEPGEGDLMVQVLIEELQGLLPRRDIPVEEFEVVIGADKEE